VKSQELIKAGILQMIEEINSISIDGIETKPALSMVDFITLGPAGVITRPDPVVESLDNGIIGLTMVYETKELADNLFIDWRLFSDNVQEIETTTIDPFGGSMKILKPSDNLLHWERKLSGYTVPVLEEIKIENPRIPVISVLLFLLAGILFLISINFRKRLFTQPALLSIVGIGFILFPFLRPPIDIPVVSQWKPSKERTSVILDGLLTNVYRSFEVRNESDVYDRLSMSVIGDQLTQIYLESRESLEMENRGGARAKVDKVELSEVKEVLRSEEEDGFIAELTWMVSGSVNHFGHTHYRQNKYHALVTFVKDNQSWKIKNIEVIDEKRIL